MTFDRQECKGVGTYPKTEAFNAGPAAIGTGPYKLVRFTKGDRVILERNDAYWGEKPAWQRVIFRPITSAGPRVAALLAGDVDLIENVPIQDLERVKSNAGFKVVQGLSNRVIYLHFDYIDDKPPGVGPDAGDKNPFRDKRVREAISKAIDRDAIVARIMGGVAVAAGELLPNVMFGANKDMKAPKAGCRGRQEAARRGRLSERLHAHAVHAERPLHQRRADRPGGSADAHPHRPQGLARRHDAEPVLRQAQPARIRLLARGLGLGHRRDVLAAQIAGGDPEPRQGHAARPIPAAIPIRKWMRCWRRRSATVDDAQRAALLAEASRVAMADYGVIPLHFEMTTWAFRKGLSYVPRTDQATQATLVRKQ